nr:unnamed protein product [Digitaria exilis]
MPATSTMVIDGGDELKTSWPEVVGMQLSPAARKIRGDRADVVLEPHLVGEVPGPGYDPKRVRIFVDTSSPSSRRPSDLLGSPGQHGHLSTRLRSTNTMNRTCGTGEDRYSFGQ